MTESVFRKRLLQLWLSFTAVGVLVTRVLGISTFQIETQKVIYLAICLAAVLSAIFLYLKGSLDDYVEREQMLEDAHIKRPGKLSLFCSMFLLALMPTGLAFGIWDARSETSWSALGGLLVGLVVNLVFTTTVFRIIRNEHLRRIEERGG